MLLIKKHDFVIHAATGLSTIPSMTSSGTSNLYERAREEPDLGNRMKSVSFSHEELTHIC